jgi:hypothetical protein
MQSTPQHRQLLVLEGQQLTKPANFRLCQLTSMALLDHLLLQRRNVPSSRPHRRGSLDLPIRACWLRWQKPCRAQVILRDQPAESFILHGVGELPRLPATTDGGPANPAGRCGISLIQ